MEIKTTNRYFNDFSKKQKIVLLLFMFATVFTCIFSLSYNKMINASNRIIDDTLTLTYTFQGSGTSSDPYQISSSSDLINLSSSVSSGISYSGEYFIMTNNINLGNKEFTPIGINRDYPFNGNFNGNGNKILGINISMSSNPAGVFGYISNATISNLIISSGSITQTGDSQCAGGIVGWVNGASTIRKCTNEGVYVFTNSASGNTEAGGIVGYINGSSGQATTITWCSNHAVVENDSYSTGLTCAGGIVGRHDNYNYVNISLCKNFGTVRSGRSVIGEGLRNPNGIISAKYPYAGGIIGYHSKGLVTKSCNYGSVYSGKAFSVYQRSDGTYYIKTHTKEEELIENDHGAEISYAGGIVGYSAGSINYSAVTNCFNKGNVTAKAKSNKMDYKFLLTGIYKINDEDAYHVIRYPGGEELVFTTAEMDPQDGEKDYYAPICYDRSTYYIKNMLSTPFKLYGACRNVMYYSDLIDDDFNHMYKYDERAIAYGIGYADSDNSVSNCYNQSTVKGGKQYKKIVYKLRCGYNNAYSDYQKFVFTFNNGGRFGPISNNSCNYVYYDNKFDGVVDRETFYSINDGTATKIFYEMSYNILHTADIKYKKKTYSQQFHITNSTKSSNVWFKVATHEEKGLTNIIEIAGSECHSLFNGENYMTYDADGIGIKGSIIGSKVDDLKTVLQNRNAWAQSDIINDGTPYIKEMYWEGVNRN